MHASLRVGIGAWIVTLGPSGVARRIEALCEAARHAGIEVILFGPPEFETAGVRAHACPLPPIPARARGRAERAVLPGLVRTHRLEYVHLEHAPAHRLAVPVSVTVHDLRDFTRFARPGRRLFARPLWWLALRNASVLLAISETTAEDLRLRLPSLAGRIEVVPTGIPERFFRPQGGSPAGLEPGYLLCTGRLLAHKNLALLFSAYRVLMQSLPEAPPLVLAGPDDDPRGPGAREIQEACGLGDKLKVIGAVPEADLPRLYAGASIAVFPSLFEGQGLGPLEAMASGTPVMLSEIPAHRESAGPGGLLFDPHDPGALAARMRALLAQPGLKEELGEKGRRHAAGKNTRAMAKALSAAWKVQTPEAKRKVK